MLQTTAGTAPSASRAVQVVQLGGPVDITDHDGELLVVARRQALDGVADRESVAGAGGEQGSHRQHRGGEHQRSTTDS